jgi:hypothetical protein
MVCFLGVLPDYKSITEVWCQQLTPGILATWEAVIRRIEVPGQLGLKRLQDPISMWKKILGVVAHICHLSNCGKFKIPSTKSAIGVA